MKKIKNKFIIGVIGIIILIVASQVLVAYSHSKNDTNSYLSLVKGSANLNDTFLEQNTRYILHSGDKVSVGQTSLALIEWGDGSLTRLGENTKISIEQNQISRDFTKIQISFDLIAGKTWSNVVSFLGEGSSFTQSFQGMEAGVRGTVFDVDLDGDYLNVSDHQVILTDKQGETLLIEEGQPVQLSTLSFIEIQKFLGSIQDGAWTKLNENYDAIYFEELKKYLDSTLHEKTPYLFLLDFISPKYRILYELDTADNFESVNVLIEKLKAKQYTSVYTAVLSRYQDFNFVKVADYEFYKRKVFYRKALLLLAPSENEKEHILQYTAYDLSDMLNSGVKDGVSETVATLLEYKTLLPQIDMTQVSQSISLLPPGTMDQFQNDFEKLKTFFPEGFGVENIKDIKQQTEQNIQNFLDEKAGSFIDKFKK